MSEKLAIAIVCKITESQIKSKLKPILALEQIEKIYLLRETPIIHEKIINITPPKWACRYPVSRDLFRTFQLLRLCLREKINAIMGIYLVPHGIVAFIVAKLTGITVIQNIIGDDLLMALKNRLIFQVVAKSDISIVRGGNSRDALIRRNIDPGRIFVVPNIFNFDAFRPQKIEIKYDIIYAGHLVKVKRIDNLLKSLVKLKFEYGNQTFRAAILGDGQLLPELINLSSDLHIEENVDFIGYQKDVVTYLNQSKIFIMTSEYEGLPMAMVEAMSCGLPCVMPDVSNINTVAIHNHNAMLYPVGDIDRCAEYLNMLIENQELYARLSHNAFTIKSEKQIEYSLNNVSRIWNKCLLLLQSGTA